MATMDDDSRPMAIGNPYAAPIAGVSPSLPVDFSDPNSAAEVRLAQTIRERCIGQEAVIKAIGSFFYLLAGLFCLALVVLVLAMLGAPKGSKVFRDLDSRHHGADYAIAYLIPALITGYLGYGLHSLRRWARWTLFALTLGALACSIVSLTALFAGNPGSAAGFFVSVSPVSCYLLFLLISSKLRMIFTQEYRDIVVLTPFIRRRILHILPPFVVLGVLVLFLAFLVSMIPGSARI